MICYTTLLMYRRNLFSSCVISKAIFVTFGAKVMDEALAILAIRNKSFLVCFMTLCFI